MKLLQKFKEPVGILRYLVAANRGNEIDVTVSCNETASRPPRLIITYPNTDHWASCTTFNFSQYIQVKLKHKVSITGYSFEKRNDTYIYMMNWQFLGSNDEKNWVVLDSHINDSSFASTNTLRPKTKRGTYNFFRILNTGLNRYESRGESHSFRTILYVRYLDLYGLLCNHNKCSIAKKNSQILLFIYKLIMKSN